MAPLEDRSRITVNTKGPEGVTYEYMRDYTEDIYSLADSIMSDAESITARVWSGSGNIQITLKDLKERNYSQMEVAETIWRMMSCWAKTFSIAEYPPVD